MDVILYTTALTTALTEFGRKLSSMEESGVVVFGKILSKEDFDEICRCCLSQGPLASLFEVLCEETPLADILHALFGTQLDPNDGLPKKLCEPCITEVICCYNFKKRYEASEAALRNIVAIKIEIKSGPPTDNTEDIEETQQRKINIMKQKQSRIFRCSCQKTFTSQWEFRRHRELEKHPLPRDHQCKICGKFYPKHGLRLHLKTHEAIKRYPCVYCEKRFRSKDTLQAHMRIHTGERPYVCELCNKSFTQRVSLKVHRRIHTGEKPYLCSFCGRGFAKKVNCDVHMRTHNKLKTPVSNSKYVCDKCGRLCDSQRAYKLHLYKIHGVAKQVRKNANRMKDEEKRFLCSECGKRFYMKGALEAHSLVHSGTKSFACEFCDKKFARRPSLQYHLHVHTGERPYACSLCPKKFTQAGSLALHLKIHTGERPYGCTICDKAFIRKDTRDAHVRTHTGEKPYKCDQCTDVFGDRKSLNKHKKRKH